MKTIPDCVSIQNPGLSPFAFPGILGRAKAIPFTPLGDVFLKDADQNDQLNAILQWQRPQAVRDVFRSPLPKSVKPTLSIDEIFEQAVANTELTFTPRITAERDRALDLLDRASQSILTANDESTINELLDSSDPAVTYAALRIVQLTGVSSVDGDKIISLASSPHETIKTAAFGALLALNSKQSMDFLKEIIIQAPRTLHIEKEHGVMALTHSIVDITNEAKRTFTPLAFQILLELARWESQAPHDFVWERVDFADCKQVDRYGNDIGAIKALGERPIPEGLVPQALNMIRDEKCKLRSALIRALNPTFRQIDYRPWPEAEQLLEDILEKEATEDGWAIVSEAAFAARGVMSGLNCMRKPVICYIYPGPRRKIPVWQYISENPGKPNVRLEEELSRRKKLLNKLTSLKPWSAHEHHNREDFIKRLAAAVKAAEMCSNACPNDFIGIVVVGSTAKGYVFEDSDIDSYPLSWKSHDILRKINAKIFSPAPFSQKIFFPAFASLSGSIHPINQPHLFFTSGIFIGDRDRLVKAQKEILANTTENEWNRFTNEIMFQNLDVEKGFWRLNIHDASDQLKGLAKIALIRTPNDLETMRRII